KNRRPGGGRPPTRASPFPRRPAASKKKRFFFLSESRKEESHAGSCHARRWRRVQAPGLGGRFLNREPSGRVSRAHRILLSSAPRAEFPPDRRIDHSVRANRSLPGLERLRPYRVGDEPDRLQYPHPDR